LSLSVRGERLTIKGTDEDELDYTDQELVNIAIELDTNYNRFRDYLFSVDLLPRDPEYGAGERV